MVDITIDNQGDCTTFPAGASVTVGRDGACDVTVLDERVSRSPHLEICDEHGTWVLIDRSRGGTFLDGTKVTRVVLSGSQTFRLGGDPAGPTITIKVHGPPRPLVADHTAELSTLSADDASLRLTLGDTEAVFPLGANVLVGRGADCDLRSESLLVSRRHLRFLPGDTGWVVEDLDSVRGTFIDGRRITGRRGVAGCFSVWLGGIGAGVELCVVTAGEHHPPDKLATVTTVFTDLVGSTDLLARIGDTAADVFFRDHAALLSKVSAEYDGDVVKNTGDGLMIVFVSAVRALEAAAQMQRAVAPGLEAQGVGMRVGIATGDAAREMGDWFGVPVVQAARLCGLAEGGQILVGGLVPASSGRRGDHTLRLLGQRHLKGLPDPVDVYDLDWAEPTP